MIITKELVWLYLLDQVPDPELRRQIEQSRQTNPQVARWFDLLEVSEASADSGVEDDPPLSPEGRDALRFLLAADRGPVTIPLQASLAAAGTAAPADLELKDPKRGIHIRVRKSVGGRPGVLLRVSARHTFVRDGVCRYELGQGQEPDGALIQTGFIGVYPEPGKEDRYYGEVRVDLSDDRVRQLAVTQELVIRVPEHPGPVEELTAVDRRRIREARDATDDPQCRQVLEQVLEKLEQAGAGRDG